MRRKPLPTVITIPIPGTWFSVGLHLNSSRKPLHLNCFVQAINSRSIDLETGEGL
jgi:hypothetical protein